jgi:condensin-2 complex subunit D3
MVLIVQMLMNCSLPAPNDLDQGKTLNCPENVRATAFVTMGKLCLRNRHLAREHINVFLRELNGRSLSSAAVRGNCLLVLGDLCVRFTSLVDRHVGVMAMCLQDNDALVRRHALVLLTQLLLQDYLKWRGLLMFRLLASVADPNPEISELCKAMLRKTIKSKCHFQNVK